MDVRKVIGILNQIAEVVDLYQHDGAQRPYLFVISGGVGISAGTIPDQIDGAFCIPVDPELFHSGCYDEFLIHLDSEVSSGMTPALAANLARRYLDML